jgi:hypothetical protein
MCAEVWKDRQYKCVSEDGDFSLSTTKAYRTARLIFGSYYILYRLHEIQNPLWILYLGHNQQKLSGSSTRRHELCDYNIDVPRLCGAACSNKYKYLLPSTVWRAKGYFFCKKNLQPCYHFIPTASVIMENYFLCFFILLPLFTSLSLGGIQYKNHSWTCTNVICRSDVVMSRLCTDAVVSTLHLRYHRPCVHGLWDTTSLIPPPHPITPDSINRGLSEQYVLNKNSGLLGWSYLPIIQYEGSTPTQLRCHVALYNMSEPDSCCTSRSWNFYSGKSPCWYY